MTLETFLEKLEQTPRGWYLLNDRRIRLRLNGSNFACPVNAAAGLSGSNFGAGKSALGLNDDVCGRVVAAADDDKNQWYGPFDPELRAKLLKACGLEAQS